MSAVEILAPAGNEEMLHAAVLAGANAVYLGLESLNARRSAGNFTTDALVQAVAFCHARGVRVYVALNTTVYPNELSAVAESLRAVAKAGADAVIVQDMAVAALARHMVPALALHASTQMSVHSLAGAQQLAAMGFSRVILSRECSLAEIAAITQGCGIETETFVHGALCMSISGQCYMSAFLGGRSGNRGMCAGPCRLPFEADATGCKTACAHHLSLKDMSHVRFLPQLAAAGVSSVKIEGRLRTPEYCAAAVNACLQELQSGSYDAQLLQDVFSRSGFTDSYLEGKLNATMFGVRTGEDAAAAKAALPRLRELYRRERQSVPALLTLSLEQEGCKLAVQDEDGNRAVVYGETAPQPAQKDPTQAYERALEKTGGTPFYAKNVTVHAEEMLYLPAAEINELRRTALDALLAKRSAPRPLPCTDMPLQAEEKRAVAPSKVFAQFETLAQLPEDAACDGFILPLAAWNEVPAALRGKTWLAVPRALFGSAEAQAARLIAESRAQGFAGYFVQNLAHLKLCAGLPMLGGFGLNITNPAAAREYAALGLCGMTLSPELSCAEMAQIAPGVPTAALAYGHMPVMLTRACPLQNTRSCAQCSREGALLDRKGKSFPVRCTAPGAAGVRTVYNPIPIYMGERQREMPVDIALLAFTVETKAAARGILADFAAARPFAGEFTRGLYYKGTE